LNACGMRGVFCITKSKNARIQAAEIKEKKEAERIRKEHPEKDR